MMMFLHGLTLNNTDFASENRTRFFLVDSVLGQKKKTVMMLPFELSQMSRLISGVEVKWGYITLKFNGPGFFVLNK